MNLEELTKTQIILLTLLVSFMTSIATGIVTVSLLDQAPPTLTQTINRVVERTVERVVPTEGQTAGVITKEKETTVVVKEDDLVTSSIEKASAALVRVRLAPEFTPAGGDPFVGLGIIIARDGTIATDAAAVTPSARYVITLADGTELPAIVLIETDDGVALLRTSTEGKNTTLSSVSLASDTLKLGQTVLMLYGSDRIRVATGIVSALVPTTPRKDEQAGVAFVDTNLGVSPIYGSPLINIFGDVVGISTSVARQNSYSYFTPASYIVQAVAPAATTTAATQQ